MSSNAAKAAAKSLMRVLLQNSSGCFERKRWAYHFSDPFLADPNKPGFPGLLSRRREYLCFSELSARPTRGADACQSLRQLEMVVEGSIWPFFSGIWAHSPRRLLLEA